MKDFIQHGAPQRTYTHSDIQSIMSMRARGCTFEEIGPHFGVSGDAVRVALNRRLRGEVAAKGWKEISESMPLREGFQYLQEVIEVCMPWLSEKGHPLDVLIGVLTQYELRVFKILYDRPDRVFSQLALIEMIYCDRAVDDVPHAKIIDVYVSKMRKKIPAEIGKIKTVWGQGYQFEAPENPHQNLNS